MVAISASGANNFITTIFPRLQPPTAEEGVEGPSLEQFHPSAGSASHAINLIAGIRLGAKLVPA